MYADMCDICKYTGRWYTVLLSYVSSHQAFDTAIPDFVADIQRYIHNMLDHYQK